MGWSILEEADFYKETGAFSFLIISGLKLLLVLVGSTWLWQNPNPEVA